MRRRCVHIAKGSGPIRILPPKKMPSSKATRRLKMRVRMHTRPRPRWRFPWERLTFQESIPDRSSDLRLFSIRHREKGRVVTRERSRQKLEWRRTRNGLPGIPQPAERKYAPTATNRPRHRGPMQAIPCRDNHGGRQEARKDKTCNCRDARAHGRLDDLVAELMQIVSR